MANIFVTDDQSKLDLNLIHKYLSEDSYWAKGISYELVKRAVENSLSFGIFLDDKQVGFARMITDKATFAYLADVFILPEHRKLGLSKELIKTIMAHPDLQGLRKMLLATLGAHGLYRKFGFGDLNKPETFMEKRFNVNYLGEKLNNT